jgi:protoporphyrinogen oxidase
MTRYAIIVGAGPAGLTAAYELLQRTDLIPIVVESDLQVGGISKTVRFQQYRMDIGGHRFFSKSDRVMQWWLDHLPLERQPEGAVQFSYHGKSRSTETAADAPDANVDDLVMLVRQRHSRIFYAGHFFDYPISLSPDTLIKLGFQRAVRIGATYLWRTVRPLRPEENLEQFLINRFGDELYRTFFKSYTEKVWGVECQKISAAWGAQRIKDVSVGRAIRDWVGKRFGRRDGSIDQKQTSTSLVERFLYPKYGPGQLWEEIARLVEAAGGTVLLRHTAVAIHREGNRITGVDVRDETTGTAKRLEGDYYFSTMPVSTLATALSPPPPEPVLSIAQQLQYRDFVTVGLLVRRMSIREGQGPLGLPPDTWLYIQEPSVRLGRLQIYNNWSPFMAPPEGHVWLGLEYFCQQGDDLWRREDADLIAFASEELSRIGFIAPADLLDGMVLRVEKAYPAYYGAYHQFGEVRAYFDAMENLYLIGRNGMHKYNNQDHSMLTAMTAVDNIVAGVQDKANLWAVNTEEEYLEEMPAPGGEEDL